LDVTSDLSLASGKPDSDTHLRRLQIEVAPEYRHARLLSDFDGPVHPYEIQKNEHQAFGLFRGQGPGDFSQQVWNGGPFRPFD
jgi:hypothetical protein